MDIMTIFSWPIYGLVILFLISLWFILLYFIFRKQAPFYVLFVLWILPVSMFLGAMAFYAAKYLILLDLIK